MRGRSRSIGRRGSGACRVVVAGLAAVVATGSATVTAQPALAGTPISRSSAPLWWSDPTASGHDYRHGALPLRTSLTASSLRGIIHKRGSLPASGGRPLARGGTPLLYGGGPVVSGSPKVYLVFWGSSWGTQSTVGGYQAFSNDPAGLAHDLQAFFHGLGTDGETWSAISTQYCQNAAPGARGCAGVPAPDHVAYPSANVLGGVWEDTSFTPPLGAFPGDSSVGGATSLQIAQEAAAAAQYFGDTSLDAQYFIVSPTLANPDNWLDPVNGYCAYHDDTADPGLGGVVPGPAVAYSNIPYVPDVGATGCASTGKNGPLDGANEAASHEYAETLTDPWPISGWLDRHDGEIGDKCQYQNPGTPGAAVYLPLATGTFDVQGLWANDSGKKGGCETTHPTVLLDSVANQKGVVGTSVSLSLAGIDVLGESVTYGATGLPSGLSINPVSGLVSGAPGFRGRSMVTVSASDAATVATISFKWTVRKH